RRLPRRVGQGPGFRARRLLRGGGLRLLWFVVHGLALHEQSVCRPRCAVLAGLVGVRARKERSDKKIAARVGPVERAGALVTAARPGRRRRRRTRCRAAGRATPRDTSLDTRSEEHTSELQSRSDL